MSLGGAPRCHAMGGELTVAMGNAVVAWTTHVGLFLEGVYRRFSYLLNHSHRHLSHNNMGIQNVTESVEGVLLYMSPV